VTTRGCLARASDSRHGLALVAAAGGLFLWLVGTQLWRPLIYDDANFAFGARAIAETGRPFGNQGWMSDRGDYSQRNQWALWHPPLYVALLGAALKLPLPPSVALRLPGVLGGLATAAATALLAGEVSAGGWPRKGLSGGIAAATALVSPLFVQSALILDIDFPLLLPGMLLFLWLYLRLEAGRPWPLLVPVFALLLWAKMTNPLPLVAALVAWQVLRGRPRRAIAHGATIGAGGAGLFVASWLLVARVLGAPADMPFAVNLVQWQDSADVARRAYAGLDQFLEGVQPAALWLGPGLVGLGLAGAALRVAQLARRWDVRKVDLLIILLAPLVLGYVNKSAGWFPKYQVVLAPLLAAIGAPMAAGVLARQPRSLGAVALGAAVATGLLTQNAIGDDWALSRTWTLDPAQALPVAAVLVVALAVGVLMHEPGVAPLVLAAVAVGWGLGIDVDQRPAPYATGYWYGTTGTDAAARWVDAHVAPSQTYVAAKEVAWRAHAQRYVDQDTILAFVETGRPLGSTWQGEPITAVVAWTREPYVAERLGRAVPAMGFHETTRFGDYVVYEPDSP